jgi:hypothetical protein
MGRGRGRDWRDASVRHCGITFAWTSGIRFALRHTITLQTISDNGVNHRYHRHRIIHQLETRDRTEKAEQKVRASLRWQRTIMRPSVKKRLPQTTEILAMNKENKLLHQEN